MKCITEQSEFFNVTCVFSGEMTHGIHRTILNVFVDDKMVSIELDEKNGVTRGNAYQYDQHGNFVEST